MDPPIDIQALEELALKLIELESPELFGVTRTREQTIKATSELVEPLQNYYTDLCEDGGLNTDTTWVDFALQGHPEPWKGLNSEVMSAMTVVLSTSGRQTSETEYALEQMAKKLGILEQQVSLLKDSPAFEVSKDLPTRFEEHKSKYATAWDALPQERRSWITRTVADAVSDAETKIDTKLAELDSEVPAAWTSNETRSKRFKDLVIDNYDTWRSTSKTYRDSVTESWL